MENIKQENGKIRRYALKPVLFTKMRIHIYKDSKFNHKEEEENALDHLAAVTNGFSGADLENLCNEAAILAARDKKEKISKDNFESALDRIQGGVLKGTTLDGEVRSRAAIFNSAKVIAAWMNELADPIIKVGNQI